MKKLNTIILSIGLALASLNSAIAQVKIGSNPTTIATTSNLEVEAASGKKVKVNKANSQLSVEYTPPGALTDSLLTVETSTGLVRAISHEKLLAPVAKKPFISLGGTFTMNSLRPTNPLTIKNLTVVSRNEITYNASAGTIIISKPGMYYVTSNSEGSKNFPTGTTVNDHCASIMLNGTALFRTCGRSSRAGASTSTNGIYYLQAGDAVTVDIATASNMDFMGTYEIQVHLYKLSD